jgi:hypothetical protein
MIPAEKTGIIHGTAQPSYKSGKPSKMKARIKAEVNLMGNVLVFNNRMLTEAFLQCVI